MINNLVERFRKESQEKRERKSPLKIIKGDVTNFYFNLREKLDKKGIPHFEQNNGPYYLKILRDLRDFECYLDSYSELLIKNLHENKEILFPNVDYHVGPVTSSYLGPSFLSQERRNLANILDSCSYEKIQIIKREKPEWFEEEHSLNSNYHAAEELAGKINDLKFREEYYKTNKDYENAKLIKKYYNELNFKKQREKRLEVGKELLYTLFEESKNLIKDLD